jgi:hypothetical protein
VHRCTVDLSAIDDVVAGDRGCVSVAATSDDTYAMNNDGSVSATVTRAIAAQKVLVSAEWNANLTWLAKNTLKVDKVKSGEGAWMRPLLRDALKDKDIKSGASHVFSSNEAPLLRREPSTGRVLRPEVKGVVLKNRFVYSVDFNAVETLKLLSDFGQDSVPCGNPDCNGEDGKWHTEPLPPSHQTGGPKLVLGADSLTSALTSGRSRCKICCCVFHHFNSVTLRRMPPQAVADLPFAHDWVDPHGDWAMVEAVSSAFEYDVNHQQGAQNLADKMTIMGHEIFDKRAMEYYATAQLWRKQLEGLVGRDVWSTLPEERQLILATARAEFELASDMSNDVEPLGKASDVVGFGFGLKEVSSKWLLKALSQTLERRRPERCAAMAAIGANIWASIDWAKRQGEQVGAEWYCTVCNEDGAVIGQLATATVKAAEIEDFLKAIGERENFTANVVVLDNLPENIENSECVQLVKKALGVTYAVQDKFHVSHNLSTPFNNTHDSFFRLIIHGWRDCISVYDAVLEKENDTRLAAGAVSKNILFRDERITIKRGEAVSSEKIAHWKKSGAYDELFTSGTKCVVPRVTLSPAALPCAVNTWLEAIMAETVGPNGETLKVRFWGSECSSPGQTHAFFTGSGRRKGAHHESDYGDAENRQKRAETDFALLHAARPRFLPVYWRD